MAQIPGEELSAELAFAGGPGAGLDAEGGSGVAAVAHFQLQAGRADAAAAEVVPQPLLPVQSRANRHPLLDNVESVTAHMSGLSARIRTTHG